MYADNFNLSTIFYIDSFKVGYIPIRLAYKGICANLYVYRDMRDHYFIERNDTIQELLIAYRFADYWDRRPFLKDPPTYFFTPIYRDQLNTILGDVMGKKQKALITDCAYDLFDLKRIVRKTDAYLKKKK